jgi:hypothetical protein
LIVYCFFNVVIFYYNDKKGDISNIVTLAIFAIGLAVRGTADKDDKTEVYVTNLVMSVGLFGFSGGITNWLERYDVFVVVVVVVYIVLVLCFVFMRGCYICVSLTLFRCPSHPQIFRFQFSFNFLLFFSHILTLSF